MGRAAWVSFRTLFNQIGAGRWRWGTWGITEREVCSPNQENRKRVPPSRLRPPAPTERRKGWNTRGYWGLAPVLGEDSFPDLPTISPKFGFFLSSFCPYTPQLPQKLGIGSPEGLEFLLVLV
jgi:hypothetical protein